MTTKNPPWTLDELNTVLDASSIIRQRLIAHRDPQNVAIFNTFIADFNDLWVLTLEKEIRSEEKARNSKPPKSATPKVMVSPEPERIENLPPTLN